MTINIKHFSCVYKFFCVNIFHNPFGINRRVIILQPAWEISQRWSQIMVVAELSVNKIIHIVCKYKFPYRFINTTDHKTFS